MLTRSIGPILAIKIRLCMSLPQDAIESRGGAGQGQPS